MPYSSSLTDEEWIILEPLLAQILPTKKQRRPPNWTKREILDGIFYQLKNGCNWEDLPKDLPPYKGGILALQAVAGSRSDRQTDEHFTRSST
ncbi:MAG: transposase [Nostoc sp.]